VRVACEGADSGLRVAALGRRMVAVNGGTARPLDPGAEFFSPFAE